VRTRPRILVVDDEDRVRRSMDALLTPAGYEVLLARDGQEALEKARETLPDVILLDILMPKADGFEVARQLKAYEDTRMIPIVMVTALDAPEDRVKALEAGTDDFLTKPIDKTELKARVHSLVKVKAYNDHMRDYQRELEAEVAEKTAQLREALENAKGASLETIYRLSRAAESKDRDTGAHIQRMSLYASTIAREMGLSEQAAEDILYGSAMHDVGKIGTPDYILQKPDSLAREEWDVMKQHTVIGAQILEDSNAEFIKTGETIALSHHEKWDGSGYCRGLKGDEIPLAGRIAAIADVFDALTSSRPYRKEPFPLEEALAMIEEEKQRHFDPEVASAFFSAIDKILAIRDNHKSRHLRASPLPGMSKFIAAAQGRRTHSSGKGVT